MKPPKKKKKTKKREKDVVEVKVQPSDPVVEEKKRKFPGLSLPDNTDRVMGLLVLEPKEEEEYGKKGAGQDPTAVASQALNEVNCRANE